MRVRRLEVTRNTAFLRVAGAAVGVAATSLVVETCSCCQGCNLAWSGMSAGGMRFDHICMLSLTASASSTSQPWLSLAGAAVGEGGRGAQPAPTR